MNKKKYILKNGKIIIPSREFKQLHCLQQVVASLSMPNGSLQYATSTNDNSAKFNQQEVYRLYTGTRKKKKKTRKRVESIIRRDERAAFSHLFCVYIILFLLLFTSVSLRELGAQKAISSFEAFCWKINS